MMAKASAFMLALSLMSPLIACADVRLSEIMFDPEGSDTKREWVEIYNAGPDSVDLSKYKFTDKSNHVLNVPPKNGGTGSMTLAAGSYAVLASDATTFLSEYPGVAHVIDTTMSLNNTGTSISLSSGTTVMDSATYAKSQGGAGSGDSLQLHEGSWIHARPTPGTVNASIPSAKAIPKPVAKTPTKSKTKPSQKPTVSVSSAEAEESNDPSSIVNATPTVALEQTASAGSLGGSIWWLAAAALAIGTGAAAALISRSKKNEWDIEESE